MKEIALRESIIFVALTRPSMFMWVPMNYLFICFLFAYSSFILTGEPIYSLIFVPLWFVGILATRFDHNFMRVVLKLMECPAVPNKRIWGAQCYEPF